MDVKEVSPYLVYVGGVAAILGGLSSIVYKTPLIQKVLNISLPAFFSGEILLVLGAVGLLGGLVALYGGYKKDWKLSIIGGAVGLLSPCILSLLAIVGGILMRNE